MTTTHTDSRAAVTGLRPAPELIARYRARGLWRPETALDDLAHWAARTPDAPAIVAHEAGRGVRTLSYAELAGKVDRFAAALHALGAGPGAVVAVQLPNRWQVNALVLACARVGALAAPIMPTIRPRELERVLGRLGARICVTTDVWDGFEHAAALAALAPRLPALEHRVVLGERVAADEVGFRAFFEDAEHAPAPDAADPDRAGFALFTSGTSGEPRAALHSLNTLHAIHRPVLAELVGGPRPVLFTPHASTHAAGLNMAVLAPLLAGGTTALMDVWDPDAAVDFLAGTGVTFLLGAPVFLTGLLDALHRRGARLPLLTSVAATATAVHTGLVARVATGFGVPLASIWSMTEGGSLLVRPDDPPGWAGHSIGRPGPGTEVRLRPDTGDAVTEADPGRLAIRGAAVCLGLQGRDGGALTVPAEHDAGWLDTGDLAVPDGRGGVRLLGRAADRIGGVFMIPATDVESVLLAHPAVRDAAVVGYPDGRDGELACAVLVSDAAPTLEALRAHLREQGMTGWYLPSRLEVVPALPRNATGKVRKELLRRWLLGAAELPAPAGQS
jgi:cyclohexanecarboxylate-CoA ligase